MRCPGRSLALVVARNLALVLAAGLPTACGQAGAWVGAGPAVRTVVLDIHHSKFSLSDVEVRAGETVRFVLHNSDPIPHELIVGDEAVQDRHERGTEAHHGERAGEVSVAAGGRAATTVTFTTPGRVLFGCHLPGHWAYGMRGTIRVA